MRFNSNTIKALISKKIKIYKSNSYKFANFVTVIARIYIDNLVHKLSNEQDDVDYFCNDWDACEGYCGECTHQIEVID